MVIVSPAQKASQARIRNQGLLEANRRKVFYDDRPVKLPSPWNHAGSASASRLIADRSDCTAPMGKFSQELISKIAHKKEKGQAKNVPRGSSPFVMRSLCMNLLQDLAPHLAPLSWLDACTETTNRQLLTALTPSHRQHCRSVRFQNVCPVPRHRSSPTQRKTLGAKTGRKRLSGSMLDAVPANALRLACAAALGA